MEPKERSPLQLLHQRRFITLGRLKGCKYNLLNLFREFPIEPICIKEFEDMLEAFEATIKDYFDLKKKELRKEL